MVFQFSALVPLAWRLLYNVSAVSPPPTTLPPPYGCVHAGWISSESPGLSVCLSAQPDSIAAWWNLIPKPRPMNSEALGYQVCGGASGVPQGPCLRNTALQPCCPGAIWDLSITEELLKNPGSGPSPGLTNQNLHFNMTPGGHMSCHHLVLLPALLCCIRGHKSPG